MEFRRVLFRSRMPIQMVFHEGRDEIIAVVVSGAQAKLELDASALAGALKKLGAQLFFKKTVGFALVDQERRHPSAVLNQSDRIMSAPGSLIRARSEEHTSELQSLMRTS